MNCVFEPFVHRGVAAKAVSKCVTCGRFINHGIGVRPTLELECKPASEPRLDCRYLGNAVRCQQCESCQGTVRIKIRACELYGECTIGKKLDSIACCAMCDSYEKQL